MFVLVKKKIFQKQKVLTSSLLQCYFKQGKPTIQNIRAKMLLCAVMKDFITCISFATDARTILKLFGFMATENYKFVSSILSS
jgi:hypothetical protein